MFRVRRRPLMPAAQAPQAAAPPPAPSTDMFAQLNQLNQRHASGALTDAEFAQAKQQFLAG
jgi:Short C-terminal domain